MMNNTTGKALVRFSSLVSLETEYETRTNWKISNTDLTYHNVVVKWLWSLYGKKTSLVQRIENKVVEIRVSLGNNNWIGLTITLLRSQYNDNNGNINFNLSTSNTNLGNLYKSFPFAYGLDRDEVTSMSMLVRAVVNSLQDETNTYMENDIIPFFNI